MGYSRHVRFTEPVDPRVVWSAVLYVIGAGPDFETEKYAPGRAISEPYGGSDGCWTGAQGTGGYHTDKVLAAPSMYYGADGGQLADIEDGPAGYVQVLFDVSHERVAAGQEAADKLGAAVKASSFWSDDYTPWTPTVRTT